MLDIGAYLDNELTNTTKGRPVVAFVESEDPRIIETALRLPRFLRPVFLCPRERVETILRDKLPHVPDARKSFALRESSFCDISSKPELLEQLAQAAIALPPEQRFVNSIEEARTWVATPAGFGIMATQQGHCDAVVGGAQLSPRSFFRPMLKSLQVDPVAIEAGVIIFPDEHPLGLFLHNILIIGDTGINASAAPEKLAQIAADTCAIARDIIPTSMQETIRGALVSYSHHGADEGPSSNLVGLATELIPSILEKCSANDPRYGTISIDGNVKITMVLNRFAERAYLGRSDAAKFNRGINAIIAPNVDAASLVFQLYSLRYPAARTFGVINGIGFRGVHLPGDVQIEDAVVAVKANLLRLHHVGNWSRTPHDTFFTRPRILTINPGSTSTKVAVFEGEDAVFDEEIEHSSEEMEPYQGQRAVGQFMFRKRLVEQAIHNHGLSIDSFDAVSARGGLLRPIPHGTYAINETMLRDLLSGSDVDHASNLGALIAHAIVRNTNTPAFVVDPIVVDELDDRCRITGIKGIRRRPVSHALSAIATAHRYAHECETFYEHLNLIIAHLGGGISVGAHRKGQLVDVNNAIDGEGPFTPQRSGSLPVGDIIRLCFSGKYTKEQLSVLTVGKGGFVDLLGTSDFKTISDLYAAGDPKVSPVFEALSYQIAKWICSLIPAFNGEPVDRILITGGMTRSTHLVKLLEKSCASVGCGISVYPGGIEMVALAQGVLRVLEGREKAREYNPVQPTETS